MKKLLDSVIAALEANEPVVLVSVISSSGSTPRGAGAMMVVFTGGESSGTIGGGAVEFEAQKHAMRLFSDKASHITSYTLAKNDVADLGMICGGDVTVFYEYFDPAESRSLDLFRYMRETLDKNEDSWLVRRIEDGKAPETTVFDNDGIHFEILSEADVIKPLLENPRKPGGVGDGSEGDTQYYTEQLVRAGRVFVFGGGHVAQELVPVLSHVGFSVVLYEDRENFARKELFPDAVETILGEFTDIQEKITAGQGDYAVIMTRGHQKDYEVLEQMLRTPAQYIGCIGSAKKLGAVKQRLLEAGVPEAGFGKLYCPIGLSIKAETPAEIAISIAAELILFRAGSGS